MRIDKNDQGHTNHPRNPRGAEAGGGSSLYGALEPPAELEFRVEKDIITKQSTKRKVNEASLHKHRPLGPQKGFKRRPLDKILKDAIQVNEALQ